MVVRTDLDNVTTQLTVVITRETLKNKLDIAFKKLRQQVPINGFRVGHAPMDRIKQRYGSAVLADVVNDLCGDTLQEYLEANPLHAFGRPLPLESQRDIKWNYTNLEPEYRLDFLLGLRPEIALKGVDTTEVYERYAVSDLDNLAEDDFEYARKRMATRGEVDTDIQDNDMLVVKARELEAEDGPVKEDGHTFDLTILVDTVADEAVKADLLSKKKGDLVRFNARSLENFSSDARYRKYILHLDEYDDTVVGDFYEGEITSVSRVLEAELNESFFNEVFGEEVASKEGALDVLKADIKKFYENRANVLLYQEMRERLMAANPLELPDEYLKRLLKGDKLTDKDIEDEYPSFADSFKWQLIKNAALDYFGIEATIEDVRRTIMARLSRQFAGFDAEMLNRLAGYYMKDEKTIEDQRQELETVKLINAIADAVTIKDKPIHSKDLQVLLDGKREAVEAEQAADEVVAEAVAFETEQTADEVVAETTAE